MVEAHALLHVSGKVTAALLALLFFVPWVDSRSRPEEILWKTVAVNVQPSSQRHHLGKQLHTVSEAVPHIQLTDGLYS